MALTTCPECGQSNVSDTAEACPSCCFGIRAYYDKIKQEELKKTKQEAAQKDAKEWSLSARNLKLPEKPSLSNINIRTLIISLIVGLFGLLILVLAIVPPDGSDPNGGVGTFGFIVGGIGFLIFFAYFKNLFYRYQMYKLATKDFESYQKIIVAKEQDELRIQKERFAIQANKSKTQQNYSENEKTNVPKCPTCGSTDLTRLTASSRFIDRMAYGALSPEGKAQFRCNKCEYLW